MPNDKNVEEVEFLQEAPLANSKKKARKKGFQKLMLKKGLSSVINIAFFCFLFSANFKLCASRVCLQE